MTTRLPKQWIEFSKIVAAVNLSENERVVKSAYTTCQVLGGEFTRRKGLLSVEKTQLKSEINGCLLATNLRLLFVEKRGTFNVSYHCRVSLPYEKIVGVSIGGSWGRYLALADSDGTEYRLGATKEIEDEWKNLLQLLILQRRKKVEAEEKGKRIQLVVDFSFLKSIAEKGGLLLTTVSCPHCGGQVELPKSGEFCKCNYCGKQVYAIDIFDKMKDLISSFESK